MGDRLLPSGYPGSPLAAGGEAAVSYDPAAPPPLSSSPSGYAKSQSIDRSDPGPAAILPWRDTPKTKRLMWSIWLHPQAYTLLILLMYPNQRGLSPLRQSRPSLILPDRSRTNIWINQSTHYSHELTVLRSFVDVMLSL